VAILYDVVFFPNCVCVCYEYKKPNMNTEPEASGDRYYDIPWASTDDRSGNDTVPAVVSVEEEGEEEGEQEGEVTPVTKRPRRRGRRRQRESVDPTLQMMLLQMKRDEEARKRDAEDKREAKKKKKKAKKAASRKRREEAIRDQTDAEAQRRRWAWIKWGVVLFLGACFMVLSKGAGGSGFDNAIYCRIFGCNATKVVAREQPVCTPACGEHGVCMRMTSATGTTNDACVCGESGFTGPACTEPIPLPAAEEERRRRQFPEILYATDKRIDEFLKDDATIVEMARVIDETKGLSMIAHADLVRWNAATREYAGGVCNPLQAVSVVMYVHRNYSRVENPEKTLVWETLQSQEQWTGRVIAYELMFNPRITGASVQATVETVETEEIRCQHCESVIHLRKRTVCVVYTRAVSVGPLGDSEWIVDVLEKCLHHETGYELQKLFSLYMFNETATTFY